MRNAQSGTLVLTPYTLAMAPPSSPGQARPAVAVIILNWNGRQYLQLCLDALASQTYPNFEIWLVDNGSTDGSVELVASRYPQVHLVRNRSNLGFAAANNQAFGLTDTPYVATLNNDTVVDPGWLAALVEAAEGDPRIGSVSSKMVFAHNPGMINSCGIAVDRLGIAWDLWGGRPESIADRPREIFGACAGAALYRRTMLDDIGLFAEEFFAYLEDVDLAWRARLRGWRSVFTPAAVVRHVHSATLGDASPRKRFLLARNSIWTIGRCLPNLDVPSVLLMAGYELAVFAFQRMARRGFTRRSQSAPGGPWRAILYGRTDGLAHLPRVWQQRKAIQAGRTATLREIREAYSPVVAPWNFGDRYQHLMEGRKPRPAQMPKVQSPLRARIRLLGLRVSGWLLAHAGTARKRVPGASATPEIRKIVMLRPDHLGDVLLSRPAIQQVRDRFPDVPITVVAGPWAAASLQGLDCQVATFAFPGFERRGPGGLLAHYWAMAGFAARLRREHFDAAVILRPDHWWGAMACALAGIPVRVGHGTPAMLPFLTLLVTPQERESAVQSALRTVNTLGSAAGLNGASRVPLVRFEPSPAGVEEIRKRSAPGRDAGGRPMVALHPGAGAAVKLWPAARWAAVVQDLEDGGVEVLIAPGPDDDGLVQGIQKRLTKPIAVLPGLSWDQLAALYRQVQVVMGMDSGPLHLAAAVGTPTVRLYGPSDVAIYGPAGDPARHRVIVSDLPCAPCANLTDPPCGYRESPPCLAQIEVAQVAAAVRLLLNQGSSGDREPSSHSRGGLDGSKTNGLDASVHGTEFRRAQLPGAQSPGAQVE
ncbi:MAG: glycosyltransferase [Chloroflexi bacterium]|nr:glycosyltransferase [Chloroflexota bacterium]